MVRLASPPSETGMLVVDSVVIIFILSFNFKLRFDLYYNDICINWGILFSPIRIIRSSCFFSLTNEKFVSCFPHVSIRCSIVVFEKKN